MAGLPETEVMVGHKQATSKEEERAQKTRLGYALDWGEGARLFQIGQFPALLVSWPVSRVQAFL